MKILITRLKLKMVFLLLFFVLMLNSCTYQNMEYDYHNGVIKTTDGYVYSRLLGSYSSDENMSLLGNPYDLLVWFEFDNHKYQSVTIERLVLKNSKKIIFLAHEKLQKKNSTGKNVSIDFMFNNLVIDYCCDLLLVIDYKVEGSKDKRQIKMKIKKDYRNFKSNILWDMIMSV